MKNDRGSQGFVDWLVKEEKIGKYQIVSCVNEETKTNTENDPTSRS